MGVTHGPRLLIVEDDDTLRRVLRDWLAEKGFVVFEAADAAGFWAASRGQALDLVLLDLVLPDGDGLELLRELRETSALPVFVISSRCEDSARLAALEMVANDYITKPFNLRELELRIRNFLNWASGSGHRMPAAGRPFQLGPWTVDPENLQLRQQNGLTVRLTPSEANLLKTLLVNPDRVVTRTELHDAVARGKGEITPESLTVLIYRLRRKLADERTGGGFIATVPGIGYRLHPDGNAT